MNTESNNQNIVAVGVGDLPDEELLRIHQRTQREIMVTKIDISSSSVLFQRFGAGCHISDLCYDIYSAIKYYWEGNIFFMWWTIVFGVFSSFFVSLLSCVIYYINYQESDIITSAVSFENPERCWKFFKWGCHLFLIAPVARYIASNVNTTSRIIVVFLITNLTESRSSFTTVENAKMLPLRTTITI